MACTLGDCVKEIGINATITEKSKAIHSLNHITSIPLFTELSMQYASPPALNNIVQFNREKTNKNYMAFLSHVKVVLSLPHTTLCGHIFDVYAIELLEGGGNFPCQQLVGRRTKIQPMKH
jgi:hypothetical protein